MQHREVKHKTRGVSSTHSHYWHIVYYTQNFKLFGFPIFRFWAYLMKVIPETRRVH